MPIRPPRALTGLCALVVLLVARVAAADGKQCVTDNNLGGEQRLSHHLLASRESYRACLADPECPAVVRTECEAALAELKRAIPTLLVSVLDRQRHDVVTATLQVDGRPVVVDGSPLEMDPGSHQFLATGGGASTTLQVVAVENEANRAIEIMLATPPAEAALAWTNPTLVASERGSFVPSYVLGGIGVLGAASFAYFGLSGSSGYDDLQQCKPHCTRGAVSEVRTKYLLADVSLGVSVLALASAGYFLFRAEHAQSPRTSGLSLGFAAAPQAAGLSLRLVR